MTTTYFKNLVISKVFNVSGASALPTSFYLGLSTSAPTAVGTYSEPSGGDYTRKSVTFGRPSGTANGAVKNTNAISFTASGDWGSLSYYCIFDAQTSGNLLAYGELNPHRTVEADTTLNFATGVLELSISD